MLVRLSVRNVARVLFKRRKTLISFFALSVLLAAAYVTVATPKFRSDAAIVVKFSAEITSPEMNQQRTQPTPNAEFAKQIVNSNVAMLGSMDLLVETIKQRGIDTLYPKLAAAAPMPRGTPMDAAVEQLSRDLEVKVGRDSNILLLSLFNPDPAVARETLKTLITLFMGMQAKVMRDPRSRFLQDQLDTARAQVDAAQSALLEYKQRNGISALEQERSLLLDQRNEIESSISLTVTKVADAQKRRDALRASAKRTPAEIAISNENDRGMRQIDDALSRLNSARLRYQQAKATYVEGNPLLDDMRAELSLAERNHREVMAASQSRVRSGTNPVHQSLMSSIAQAEADLAANQAVLNQWTGRIQAVRDRLALMDRQEGELLGLQRKLDVAVQSFTNYLQRTEEARISEDLNVQRITSLAIVQEPNLPFKPARPRVLLLLVLGVLVGLMGGIGICLALEAMDETIGMPEQVGPMLGLPVLITLNRARPGTG